MVAATLSAPACTFSGFSFGNGGKSDKSDKRTDTLDDRTGGSDRDTRDERGGSAREGRTEAPKPPLVVPQGTKLSVTLSTALASGESRVGDVVMGKLATPLVDGDRVLVPAGSELRGTVTTSISSGKTKGRGQIAFRFDHISVRGQEYEIGLAAVDVLAKSGKRQDAKMIGGGAAGGALIGAIVGGKKGALIGAGVGAGAGTGASLATRGPQAKALAVSTWMVRTTRELSLPS